MVKSRIAVPRRLLSGIGECLGEKGWICWAQNVRRVVTTCRKYVRLLDGVCDECPFFGWELGGCCFLTITFLGANKNDEIIHLFFFDVYIRRNT